MCRDVTSTSFSMLSWSLLITSKNNKQCWESIKKRWEEEWECKGRFKDIYSILFATIRWRVEDSCSRILVWIWNYVLWMLDFKSECDESVMREHAQHCVLACGGVRFCLSVTLLHNTTQKESSCESAACSEAAQHSSRQNVLELPHPHFLLTLHFSSLPFKQTPRSPHLLCLPWSATLRFSRIVT